AWEEVRTLMWNYVSIVRSNKRLWRAQDRLALLLRGIRGDYWDFVLSPGPVRLRNIAPVAAPIVQGALIRKESRGLHYSLDSPARDDRHWLRDTVLQRGRRP